MQHNKAEIITIGTELLLGQILNTNAQWLSEHMAQQGINVYHQTVVGDNHERVQSAFQMAQARSDIIIVSGGLGPTDDDMTREAFQSLTSMEMVEDTITIKKIKDFFVKRDMPITPNNRRQARGSKQAHVLQNDVGMAPGMIVSHDGRTWVFLPGVPKEMKHMFQTHVMPYLVERMDHQMVIRSMILRFIGIGESQLEHELYDMIKNQDNPTIAPLAQSDGLIIRLTAKDETAEAADMRLEKTKAAIKDRVGTYLYGINQDAIEEKAVHLLKKQNKRLSAAESLTGGLFTQQLVGVSGASDVCPGSIVAYDAQTKQNLLHISPQLIQEHGVVSSECAIAMARNVRDALKSHIGISFTGVAGPNTLENQDVGTVYICVYESADHYIVHQCHFHGDRNDIRRRTTLKGFELLFNFLTKAESAQKRL